MPKPPTYEEALAGILEGKKQMYVDPQYLPPEQQDLPPEYDEDERPDYALDEDDRTTEILKDLEITDYDNVEKMLNEPGMTPTKIRTFLNNKVLKLANLRRNQLKGFKTLVTKAYKKGMMGEAKRAIKNKRIDDSRAVLNQYIKYYENKVKETKGSGIRKRGDEVMFFNNPKQLLKKLELIISEIMAGNTSCNTGHLIENLSN